MTWQEELKMLLNNPRTGLKESSNTNKTRYAILALFDDAIQKTREDAVREALEKLHIGYDISEGTDDSVVCIWKKEDDGSMILVKNEVIKHKKII